MILKEDHTAPVVSLHIWARCGAIDENPRIYGISHGLEHMVFKGTTTRPTGEITRLIESNGGLMNAATQLETTHYYIDIPSYGADTAIDILADTILNPTFPQDELERERLVILEEIHRRDDSPDATLWDEFSATVFKNTPYGIKVIGNEKTVSAMSREDLFTYFRTHYVPSKLNVVVVGDINKTKMLKRISTLFAPLKEKTPPPTPIVDLSAIKPGRVSLKKPIQLAYVAMGLATIGLGHEDVIALDMLADVLGGGNSSRLYQKLRETDKSVLSLSCDYLGFQQKGLFAFFAETRPDKLETAVKSLEVELAALPQNPIRPDELKRAKARVKSDWLYGAETPHGQASSLGSLSVLGQIHHISTYLKRVDALSVDDLMAAYASHIAGKKFSLATVEPKS